MPNSSNILNVKTRSEREHFRFTPSFVTFFFFILCIKFLNSLLSQRTPGFKLETSQLRFAQNLQCILYIIKDFIGDRRGHIRLMNILQIVRTITLTYSTCDSYRYVCFAKADAVETGM
jgi:hypothetical protein